MLGMRADTSQISDNARWLRRRLETNRRFMDDLGKFAYENVKRETPKKTGTSRSMWKKKSSVSEDAVTWEVWNDYFTIPFLEHGTKGHMIIAAAGSVLSWIDEKTGKRLFSKGHYVRGIKAVGMVRRTAAALNRKLMAEMASLKGFADRL